MMRKPESRRSQSFPPASTSEAVHVWGGGGGPIGSGGSEALSGFSGSEPFGAGTGGWPGLSDFAASGTLAWGSSAFAFSVFRMWRCWRRRWRIAMPKGKALIANSEIGGALPWAFAGRQEKGTASAVMHANAMAEAASEVVIPRAAIFGTGRAKQATVAPSTNGRYKALPSQQHKSTSHLLRIATGLAWFQGAATVPSSANFLRLHFVTHSSRTRPIGRDL